MCGLLRVVVVLLGLLPAVGWTAAPAPAHSPLAWTEPVADVRVAVPPRRVLMRFTVGVDAAHSRIAVIDPRGRHHEVGPPTIGVNEVLVASVDGGGGLGRWRVEWDVRSWDAHRNRGSFAFRVAEPPGRSGPGVPLWAWAAGALGTVGVLSGVRRARAVQAGHPPGA